MQNTLVYGVSVLQKTDINCIKYGLLKTKNMEQEQ